VARQLQPTRSDRSHAGRRSLCPAQPCGRGWRPGRSAQRAHGSREPALAHPVDPVSAIPEFIDTGVHGVLSADAPDRLAAHMADLAANPDKGAAMADAAYARLKSEFAMQPGIDQLADRLRSVMAA